MAANLELQNLTITISIMLLNWLGLLTSLPVFWLFLAYFSTMEVPLWVSQNMKVHNAMVWLHCVIESSTK